MFYLLFPSVLFYSIPLFLMLIIIRSVCVWTCSLKNAAVCLVPPPTSTPCHWVRINPLAPQVRLLCMWPESSGRSVSVPSQRGKARCGNTGIDCKTVSRSPGCRRGSAGEAWILCLPFGRNVGSGRQQSSAFLDATVRNYYKIESNLGNRGKDKNRKLWGLAKHVSEEGTLVPGTLLQFPREKRNPGNVRVQRQHRPCSSEIP